MTLPSGLAIDNYRHLRVEGGAIQCMAGLAAILKPCRSFAVTVAYSIVMLCIYVALRNMLYRKQATHLLGCLYVFSWLARFSDLQVDIP